MEIDFDPAKNEINISKHGISLARAADLEIRAVIEDTRLDYGEVRYRAFGFIEGAAYCLAFAVRGDAIRAISLRRAHSREMKRYAP
jgi:uncharacterized protein